MPSLASGRLCWKGPFPARLRISRDVTYCWTWGLTLNSDSGSSSQLSWLTANCQEADHKVWEWDLCQRVFFFFFRLATNYENQDLEWAPPWLTNLDYGALSLVCSWIAPGGALTHSVISSAPRPSQWGRRVGRLTLLLCDACSQAPAFLVLNLAVGSVSQLPAPSTELGAACHGPGLPSSLKPHCCSAGLQPERLSSSGIISIIHPQD